MGKTLPPLSIGHPEYCKLYNPTLNNGVEYSELFPGSHEKRVWSLPCGHNITRRVQYFLKSQSCSVCSNSRCVSGVNDLFTVNPEYVKNHWDYSKNSIQPTELVSSSSTKIWHKCSYGDSELRELRLAVRTPELCVECDNRSYGRGRSLSIERSLSGNGELLTVIAPELEALYCEDNKYKFSELTDRTFVTARWSLNCGHTFERAVAYFVESSSCPVCSNKVLVKGVNDLKTVRPDLYEAYSEELNKINKDEFVAGPSKTVVLNCVECTNSFSYRVDSTEEFRCFSCLSGGSLGERELSTFLREVVGVHERNDRTLVKPLELDILFKDKNVTIEYNGDYWHSDELVRAKTGKSALEYHLYKKKLCEEVGVKLYFV